MRGMNRRRVFAVDNDESADKATLLNMTSFTRFAQSSNRDRAPAEHAFTYN